MRSCAWALKVIDVIKIVAVESQNALPVICETPFIHIRLAALILQAPPHVVQPIGVSGGRQATFNRMKRSQQAFHGLARSYSPSCWVSGRPPAGRRAAALTSRLSSP